MLILQIWCLWLFGAFKWVYTYIIWFFFFSWLTFNFFAAFIYWAGFSERWSIISIFGSLMVIYFFMNCVIFILFNYYIIHLLFCYFCLDCLYLFLLENYEVIFRRVYFQWFQAFAFLLINWNYKFIFTKFLTFLWYIVILMDILIMTRWLKILKLVLLHWV